MSVPAGRGVRPLGQHGRCAQFQPQGALSAARLGTAMPRARSPDFGLRKTQTALLVLDMISDFDFPDGSRVLRAARRILPSIVRLRSRARAAGAAVIYVNDNIGPWRSDF